MADKSRPKFIIVGGGLAGALTACYLGRSGYEVEVYEMRDDMRSGNIPGGRSINLALSHRGIEALTRVDLAEKILKDAVPMPGRMIHSIRGKLSFQPYGKDRSQAINSVSRGGLNATLLEAADEYENVRLHFNERCTDVNIDSGRIELLNTQTNESTTATGDIIVSADGAFSVVRHCMQKLDRFDYSQSYLEHGFKELIIPPDSNGSYRLEKNALHIWPRRSFMMIALPNADGSFTCTLFWPFEGPNSFASIKNENDLMRFFNEQFPDVVQHMPTLAEDYFENPVGSMVTIRSDPWYYKDKVVLLGDACHAIVPFYGQGINAGFEDMIVLDECLKRYQPDWERAFQNYYRLRKKNVDMLAEMAISNFIEMRDRTGSKWFLFKKKSEKILHKLSPRLYIPLYSMATFTRIPYIEAVRRAKNQNRVVVGFGLIVLIFFIALLLYTVVI